MEETKVQSILRQIEETKHYIGAAGKDLIRYNERLEAFECLLKDTIERETAINLTDAEF